MTRDQTAKEREGFLTANLLHDDPIRSHAKAGLDDVLGCEFRSPVTVEKIDPIVWPDWPELCRVLDCDDAFARRNLSEEPLYHVSFTAAGRAADTYGLALFNGSAEELPQVSFLVEPR